jgi:hypothetical protein
MGLVERSLLVFSYNYNTKMSERNPLIMPKSENRFNERTIAIHFTKIVELFAGSAM